MYLVIMIDVAHFTRKAVFNRRNSHVLDDENSHATQPLRLQQLVDISVLADIIDLPARSTSVLFEDLPLPLLQELRMLHLPSANVPPNTRGKVHISRPFNFLAITVVRFIYLRLFPIEPHGKHCL